MLLKEELKMLRLLLLPDGGWLLVAAVTEQLGAHDRCTGILPVKPHTPPRQDF